MERGLMRTPTRRAGGRHGTPESRPERLLKDGLALAMIHGLMIDDDRTGPTLLRESRADVTRCR